MKEYRTPTLTLVAVPQEDILAVSGNLVLGGLNGIESGEDEVFGGFHAY